MATDDALSLSGPEFVEGDSLQGYRRRDLILFGMGIELYPPESAATHPAKGVPGASGWECTVKVEVIPLTFGKRSTLSVPHTVYLKAGMLFRKGA